MKLGMAAGVEPALTTIATKSLHHSEIIIIFAVQNKKTMIYGYKVKSRLS